MNVEPKEQSKQWMHTHSPNKFKQMLSARKLMARGFWDGKGVLMEELMQRWTTVTSEVHCETLKTLRKVIQNNRRGMLTSGVVFLHDNAPLRCSHSSTARTFQLGVVWSQS
jgi:hypothetical protein